MSSRIQYQDKDVGTIHFCKGGKYILVFKEVSNLESLLKLNPADVLKIDGIPESYESFREEILSKTDRIYTSSEAYVINEFPFPFGKRVPNDLLKKFES